ncbi:head-tail connector protein [Desulfovibrio sp. OttesenSCG-928-G15]|nr:head-tail connector protein [Desulfovibrio sp. OttesenSCG-928-G15]
MGDKEEKVQELKRYIAYLVELRKPWAQAWESVREHARPMRGFEVNSLKPKKAKVEDLISDKTSDSFASRAMRILAAGLHSGLTPQSRSWFSLRIQDEDLMKYGPVEEWLYTVERRIYAEFARSNFYPAIHAVYADLVSCCSGCFGMSARPGVGVVFQDVPIGLFAWARDVDGKINTTARYFTMTAKELVLKYGNRVHESTRRIAEKEPFREMGLYHVVMPRPYSERQTGKIDNTNKPFASYLFEEGNNTMIDEGGFNTFPYLCARWDVIGGEIYGRGVGFDNLADIRMLQAIGRDQAMAIRMSVTPPMKVPASLKGQPLYLIPGAKNYVSENMHEAIGPLYEVRADIAAATAKIADLRQAIREGEFNDLFLMLANDDKTMTAYEVAQKNSEKLMMLGPIVGRHQSDILDPGISGVFQALSEMGAFPPPPEELADTNMDIEFTSILALAQRLTEAVATRNIINDAKSMAEVYPEIIDKVDFDKSIDRIALVEGSPPDVVRSDEVVAQIRQQRAEQQAAQAQQQEMMMREAAMIEQAKTLGDTNTQPGSALGDLLGAAS